MLRNCFAIGQLKMALCVNKDNKKSCVWATKRHKDAGHEFLLLGVYFNIVTKCATSCRVPWCNG